MVRKTKTFNRATFKYLNIGVQPSGKASEFGSDIQRFESFLPSNGNKKKQQKFCLFYPTDLPVKIEDFNRQANSYSMLLKSLILTRLILILTRLIQLFPLCKAQKKSNTTKVTKRGVRPLSWSPFVLNALNALNAPQGHKGIRGSVTMIVTS